MPKVSIIILNWNGLRDTIECLESLKKIIYPNYEVIVVDNGSRGNDVDILEEKFGRYIRLIRNEENLGFAQGNNIGISRALEDKDCKYIFCLNNDTIIEKDSLDNLLFFAENEKYDNFGSFQPKMIWYYHPEVIDSVGLDYSKNGLGFNRGGFEPVDKYNNIEEIFGCCGGAVLYRRSVIEWLISQDGYAFDPEFFAYYEDIDISLRLQLMESRSLFVPGSVILHKRGGSANKISKKTLYWGHRNNIYVLAKNIPLRFLLKNVFLILFAELASIGINFIKRGSLGFTIMEAKVVGFLRWGKFRTKGGVLRKSCSRENWGRIEKMFITKWRVKSYPYV